MSFENPIRRIFEGIGNINYQQPPPPAGAPPGFINVAGARNGLTVDTDSFIVLGQDVGAVDDPGALLSDRDIPLSGFRLRIGTVANGTLTLKPRSVEFRDNTDFLTVLIQPPNYINSAGGVGQNFSCVGVQTNITYSNAASTGTVADYQSATNFQSTQGAVSMVSYQSRLSVQPSGISSGDAISFLSAPSFIPAGSSTGSIRGFFHNPGAGGTTTALLARNIAIETVNGYVLLNTSLGTTNKGQGVGIMGFSRTNLPTAFLHLGPGLATAGRAPFKFSGGVLTTIPEGGAMEYDSLDLFFTNDFLVRRRVVVGNAGAAAPVSNPTPVFTNFYGANTIALGAPASWLITTQAGTTYKIPLYT